MSAPFGFVDLARAIEQRLRTSLGWTSLSIPEPLAHMAGAWKGRPAVLTARAYTGSHTHYARIVEVATDDSEIANLLVLPRAGWQLPILGVDLIAPGGPGALAVADLSPVTSDPERRAEQIARVDSATSGLPPLPSAGELPAWARAWFSPAHLFARVGPDARSMVAAHLEALASACVSMVEAGSRSQPVEQERDVTAIRAYCAAHLEDDRGLQMLTRMFEPVAARRVLTEVMFPVEKIEW